MNTSLRIRLAFLSLVFIGLVLLRLFYWQVVVGDELAIAAVKQHLELLEIPAKRGQILSSDGFPLVTSEEVFLVFASPRQFQKDPGFIAREISPLLTEESCVEEGIDFRTLNSREKESLIKEKFEEINKKLAQSDLAWVPLQHKVSRETKVEIEKLEFDGIGFETQQKRIYPEGTASAHLLGFVGSDAQGREKGYFGLEGFYDLEIRGRPGQVRREKDASGKPILTGVSFKEEKRDGRDLLTTIDRAVQFIIEKNLKKGLERYGALSGSVVVMDPHDGAVIGMISLPAYDPNLYFKSDPSLFPNKVVASSYEPGSTFKVIVMAAAIDEKVVEPETKCSACEGPRIISGYSVNTWNDQYYPDSTVSEILIHSDNVGMVFVGEKLGKERFFKYLTEFGLGQLTGIDLQEEDTPPLRPEKEWKEIDLATASFGQGIAITPIQMIRAVATIANGGKLVKPYVIRGIFDEGNLRGVKPESGKRVIEPLSAKIVTQMMVEAVEKGEAKWAKPQGFKIAGKTGTAQIPVAGHYEQEKTIASFVGFSPPDEPRFIMLVTLQEPSSSPWGSETAAPLWFEIAKELFTYFGISPG